MPETGITQKHQLTFIRRHNSRRAAKGASQGEPVDLPSGRLPRVSRLMALAIRFDRLLETGTVRDQTELAELGHVTRARVTQIMNMLYLAPDIQEAILHLPRISERYDVASPIHRWPQLARRRERRLSSARQSTGRIWLLCYEIHGGLKEHRKDRFKGRVLMTWTDDEGITWAPPRLWCESAVTTARLGRSVG